MPFNDVDLKKMIKAQLERKIKYPSKAVDKLDAQLIHLINLMLEPDVTRRANIEKVIKHPWLAVQT